MTKIKNSIIGYVCAEKSKDGYKIGSLATFETIDPKETLYAEKKISNLLKRKADKLFVIMKEEFLIENKLRQSIKKSLELAYTNYLERNELEDDEDLKASFEIVKAINILTGTSTVDLLVKSDYDGKELPVVYSDNITIYKEVMHNPMILRESLKTHLPEVYKNIVEMQAFPNAKIDDLGLKKNEVDLLMSMKKKWKTLPIEKIKSIKTILSRIQAYKELEGC